MSCDLTMYEIRVTQFVWYIIQLLVPKERQMRNLYLSAGLQQEEFGKPGEKFTCYTERFVVHLIRHFSVMKKTSKKGNF